MKKATLGLIALAVTFALGILLGWGITTCRCCLSSWNEGFSDLVVKESTQCVTCGGAWRSCKCPGGSSSDQEKCPSIDWSKYVLKSLIPAPPDMSRYMLKTECPPPPDMSKYILKTAVPPCPPCIATCNKPCKIGECPPCPVQRCPVVECPPPKECPPCAVVEPPRCPEPRLSCKADYDVQPNEPWAVRPLLSTISNL